MSRSRCSGCPVEECPVEEWPVEESPTDTVAGDSLLVGWRLAVASVGLFLVPIVLAIVGGVCAGKSPDVQLPGTLAGLGLGLAGSVWVARVIRRVDNTKA